MKRVRQSSLVAKTPVSVLTRLAGTIALGALFVSAPVLAEDSASAAPAASFQIQSPTATTSVRSPVAVEVLLHGATIGSPQDGLDHLHIVVDHGEVIPIYKMPLAPLTLAPGQHTLEVDLAGPNHRPLTAPQSVTFTVIP